jgi:vitamin B12 transporter
VVTASRIETPLRQVGAAVSVITGENVRLRGYNSMADVLRTQPGIAVSSAGGVGKTTTLRIRGEDGFRTLALIDGVKISDPTAPQVGPSFDDLLTTSDLARVEVLRGPQGFIYGADAGGVVNIMTRTGEGPMGGLLGFEVGDYGTSRLDANASGGSERGDYFVSATRLRSDGFNARIADVAVADADGYDNTSLHAKLGWNATDNLRLQVVARDVDARNEYDACGFPTTYDCVGTSRRQTYRVSADLDTGKLGNLFAFSNTDVDTDNLADGESTFATDGGLARAEYVGSYAPTESVTLVYGAELQRERIRSSPDAARRDQKAYFFEYQGRINEHVFVSAGSRYDDNEVFGHHTSSRLSAAYLQDLADGATIKYRASVGTGFRAPSLYELAYNRGPFALPPAAGVELTEESTSGYDLGVEFFGASGLSAELTYFEQRIEDEIRFDLSGFSGYLQPSGTTTSEGVELGLTVPVGEQWSFLGNFTYNRTEDSQGLQRIRRPRKFGNFGARYLSPSEKLRLIANYRLSRDAVDAIFGLGRVPLDDYDVLDVSVSYALSGLLELYGRAENLTDERYEEVTGFNTAGRTLWTGVRLRF